MINQELNEAISSLDINEKKAPIHINFYIKWYNEDIKDLEEEIIGYNEEIDFFKQLKIKQIGNTEMVKLFNTPIDQLLRKIDICKDKIKENKIQLKQFENCNEAYKKDFSNGLYYDRYTGDITDDMDLAYLNEGVR